MNDLSNPLFAETQVDKPAWLLFFVIGIAGFITVLAVLQLFFRIKVGTHPVSNGVLIVIWAAVGVLRIRYSRKHYIRFFNRR